MIPRIPRRLPPVLAVVLISLRPLLVLSGDVVGWRTDGSGSYTKAQPPLEWSTTKNVVWRTPMPGASNSQPVLVGHRIFICSEPCTLLCLHRDDSKILWQKNSSYDELEIPAATRSPCCASRRCADPSLHKPEAQAKETTRSSFACASGL
jgi:hypothetical protein